MCGVKKGQEILRLSPPRRAKIPRGDFFGIFLEFFWNFFGIFLEFLGVTGLECLGECQGVPGDVWGMSWECQGVPGLGCLGECQGVPGNVWGNVRECLGMSWGMSGSE